MINLIDILVVLAVLVGILLNRPRGVVAAAEGLTGLVIGLLASSLFYEPIGRWLTSTISLELPIANIMAYGTILLIFYVLSIIVFRKFVPKPSEEFTHSKVSRYGAITLGAVKALLITAVALAIFADMPLDRTSKTELYNADLAKPLLTGGKRLQNIFGFSPGSDIAKTINLLTVEPNSYEFQKLDFTTNEIRAREDLEAKMLEYINVERQRAGLHLLKSNQEALPVARNHSVDMFQRGYFSHINPDGIDPFGRLKSAGIEYNAAGENLALASTLELAHDGLMNSPKHRANILHEQFEEVSIAVVQSREHGMMITQIFLTK